MYGSQIIDRDFILSIYSNNKFYALQEFKKQMIGEHDDTLDAAYIEEKLSDAEARKPIEHIIKTKQIPEITKDNLSEVIDKIKEIKNMSKDQIFRILEINRNKFYYGIKK